jgi:hypothetical protein
MVSLAWRLDRDVVARRNCFRDFVVVVVVVVVIHGVVVSHPLPNPPPVDLVLGGEIYLKVECKQVAAVGWAAIVIPFLK